MAEEGGREMLVLVLLVVLVVVLLILVVGIVQKVCDGEILNGDLQQLNG